MIKIKCVLCVLILCFTSAICRARTFRVGNFEYETVKKGLYANEVKLKKDLTYDANILIPETINYEGVKYFVGIIGSDAFADNSRISTVTIPGSVYLLDQRAFKNLPTLRAVTAQPTPSENFFAMGSTTVKKPHFNIVVDSSCFALIVSQETFSNCEQLETVNFSARRSFVLNPPKSNHAGTAGKSLSAGLGALVVNSLSYPFENCKSLRSVVFGDVVFKEINGKVFNGCHALTEFVTSTENPSKYYQLLEPDCPFMRDVYPKISRMSDSDYLTYLNQYSGHETETTEGPSHNTREDTGSTVTPPSAPVPPASLSADLVATADIMTVPIQRKDNNGAICALLKVISPQGNLSFEGNVVGGVEYRNGNQYWVYMSTGSQKIKINAPGITPKLITFNDYGIHHLESKRIYEYSYKGIPTQKLRIVFVPVNATVLIDGSLYEGDNGVVEADLPLGEHSYIVAAKGFVSAEGIVKLKSDGRSNININLTESSKQ